MTNIRCLTSTFMLLAMLALPIHAEIVGHGLGLQGQYFTGNELTTLKSTRTDPVISFDWAAGGPEDLGLQGGNFSARWTGYLVPKYSEAYTIYVISDDGVRMWVDGKQLVNDWTGHGATEFSGKIDLVAGRFYDIKIEFYQGSGPAFMQLLWSSTSQAREVIPQSYLYPPVFSGRTFVYTDSPDLRDGSIFLLTVGEAPKRLTQAGEGEPSITLDGNRIAFTSGRNVTWGDPNVLKCTDIYVMNPDGTNQRRLTRNGAENRDPALSSDGTKIAFASYFGANWKIWRTNVDGGRAIQVTKGKSDDRHPCWSPDGKQIVFQSKRDGKWNIFLINADGTGETQLTKDGGSTPAFSPDGQKIAYISIYDGTNHIFIMNADGSEQKSLTHDLFEHSNPVFNVDSRQLAFIYKDEQGHSDIYTIRLDSLQEEKITQTGECFTPTWAR